MLAAEASEEPSRYVRIWVWIISGGTAEKVAPSVGVVLPIVEMTIVCYYSKHGTSFYYLCCCLYLYMENERGKRWVQTKLQMQYMMERSNQVA